MTTRRSVHSGPKAVPSSHAVALVAPYRAGLRSWTASRDSELFNHLGVRHGGLAAPAPVGPIGRPRLSGKISVSAKGVMSCQAPSSRFCGPSPRRINRPLGRSGIIAPVLTRAVVPV